MAASGHARHGLGRYPTDVASHVAIVPAGLDGVKAVSAGFVHNLVLESDGTVPPGAPTPMVRRRPRPASRPRRLPPVATSAWAHGRRNRCRLGR